MKKIYGSAAEALEGVLHDGMLIAAGGFGLCGIPEPVSYTHLTLPTIYSV